MPIHPDALDSAAHGFAQATLWASTYGLHDDDECGPEDECPGHEYSGDPHEGLRAFSDDDQAEIRDVVADFVLSSLDDVFAYAAQRTYDPSQGDVWSRLGHDFALTSAGHGTGFWDRGLGELGDRLTRAADAYGTMSAHETEDGVSFDY